MVATLMSAVCSPTLASARNGTPPPWTLRLPSRASASRRSAPDRRRSIERIGVRSWSPLRRLPGRKPGRCWCPHTRRIHDDHISDVLSRLFLPASLDASGRAEHGDARPFAFTTDDTSCGGSRVAGREPTWQLCNSVPQPRRHGASCRCLGAPHNRGAVTALLPLPSGVSGRSRARTEDDADAVVFAYRDLARVPIRNCTAES